MLNFLFGNNKQEETTRRVLSQVEIDDFKNVLSKEKTLMQYLGEHNIPINFYYKRLKDELYRAHGVTDARFNHLGNNQKRVLSQEVIDDYQNVLNKEKKIGDFLEEHNISNHEYYKYLKDELMKAQQDVIGESTLYDADGNVKMKWVKTSNKELDASKLLEVVKHYAETIKPLPPLDIKCENPDDNMVLLPIPDLHLGLYVDGSEVSHGKDWNLDIASETFRKATDFLIYNARGKAKECVIADLGDLLHADNNENRTPKNKHPLSTSDRHSKNMLRVFDLFIELVGKCLENFETVYFYSVPGNHNDQISLTLRCILHYTFKNNERFICDISKYNNVFYHKFGNSLIGFTHGHQIKEKRLNDVMFKDNLNCLSEFKYFDFYLGHYHQNKYTENSWVTCNIMKPLIVNDNYADESGFRGYNDGFMQSVIYSRTSGKIMHCFFKDL